MSLSRRSFLKLGGLTFFTTTGGGLWASAQPAQVPLSVSQSEGRQILVVIFLRGGMDGMHALVPYSEQAYYEARPNLAVPKGGVLELDDQFAFNPALRALVPHFQEGVLAPICAIGTSDRSRSHFIAQDYLEYGGEGEQGWLNRALSSEGIALSTRAHIPSLLKGEHPVLNLTSLEELGANSVAAFEGADVVSKLSRQEREYRRQLGSVKVSSSGNYPDSDLARQLETVATLLKHGIALEAVHCELGGFDTHSRQIDGLWPGRLLGLNRLLDEFANAVDVFWRDLGPLQERVTVLTVTEFGRRLAENGSLGTDHGMASASFVLGRGVRGGEVYGRWPGLHRSALIDGIDLAVTSDYRCLLNEYRVAVGGEVLFPGFEGSSLGLFSVRSSNA